MASMTDVIFLLLIFFMVTSTYVFPTALEVNLPQSTQQTTIKPSIRVYIDADGDMATVKGDMDPEPMSREELKTWLQLALEQEPDASVALYADENVPYGKIVDVLNVGAAVDVKVVLATKPTATPVAEPTSPLSSDPASGNADAVPTPTI